MRQGPPEDSSTEPLQANRSPLRRATCDVRCGRPLCICWWGWLGSSSSITCKGGRDIWVWARGTGLTGDDGTRLVEGIILDVSKPKALEQELEELATKDSLTGLLNRRELSRVLAEELERAHRYHRTLA